MKLFNTLSGEKEEFTTPDGKVRMYVCGITPYAPSHIGHAMFTVVFDVLRRYLEFKGFQVKHVQNFTDIDDKMIRAAAEQGISIGELAEANIRQYMQEIEGLNVVPAHSYPRATEEIPTILKMIQGLMDKGYAYAAGGDLYFRVRQYEDYGQLSKRTRESLLAGARVEIGEAEEDPVDFALWKGQKPGEPTWDSPWGPGRPGWHIECSAMCLAYLGEQLDIHGGGQDLIFPHHENEIAQSESYLGKAPFVRFWVHNGFLRLGEDKMSKSLGNVISTREMLDKFSSDAIRLFFLNSHYRSPLVYSEQTIASQERAAERLRNALKPGPASNGKCPEGLVEAQAFRQRFVEAMDDDLNTPKALAALFDLSREVNRGREQGQDVSEAQQTLKELAGVLGLTLEEPERGAGSDAVPFIELLIETRAKLRKARQFELADSIRDRLTELGVLLEDTPQGTEWRFNHSDL